MRIKMCMTCKHYKEETTSCTAFPDGIPEEIWIGKTPHINNIDGDVGTKFEVDESEFIYRVSGMTKDEFAKNVAESDKRYYETYIRQLQS